MSVDDEINREGVNALDLQDLNPYECYDAEDSDDDDASVLGFPGAAENLFKNYPDIDTEIFQQEILRWQDRKPETNLSARMNTKYLQDLCRNA